MRKYSVQALAVVAFLAAGCGSTPPPAASTTSPGTVAPAPSPTTLPVPSPSPAFSGTPSYNYHFEATGEQNAVQMNGGGALTVSTATTLQVTLTAGNGLPLAGTGGTVGFNCEVFTIQVGNVEQTAFIKKAYYTAPVDFDPCADAQTSWSYDFSSALTTGQQTAVPIVINGAETDNCRIIPWISYSTPGFWSGGCDLSTLYSPYAVDGFISVWTDTLN